MTAQSPEEAMQQYLHPTYWDGHSIGLGEATPSNARYSSAAVRLAKQVVNDFLQTNRSPYPLETYAPGTEIDSDQWSPGSLLYGRREYLRGVNIANEHSPDDIINPPTPPTDLTFTPGEKPDLIGTDTHLYLSAKEFFVVANFGKDGNRLMPVAMHDINVAASGLRRAVFVHISLQKEFAINKTTHSHNRKGYETLERVNALSLASRGQSKKRSSLAEQLATLGLLPQAR